MFILASASPRRKELLEQIAVEFKIAVSDVDEVMDDDILPEKLVRENARLKAMAVAAENPGKWVLGADTVVALDNHIYGKPVNAEDATGMLKKLSGKKHTVSTGIAWVRDKELFVESVTTEVYFATMTDEEITAYVNSGEPMGKAGAYAIQGKAAVFVEKINGSYSNVVGLPIHAVTCLAKKAGVDLYGNDVEGFTE